MNAKHLKFIFRCSPTKGKPANCNSNDQALISLALRPFSLARVTRNKGDAIADKNPISRKIGPYVVLRELGRGGMGVVFLALHERHASLGGRDLFRHVMRGERLFDLVLAARGPHRAQQAEDIEA